MKWSIRKKITGVAFVAPWIAGFLAFTAYPLIETIRYSFGKVRVQVGEGIQIEFRQFDNYKQVLTKTPEFLKEVPAYVQEIVLFVPMTIVFSILLALLLNKPMAGRRILRAIFFLPVILMSGPLLQNIMDMGATRLTGAESFILYLFIEEYFPVFLKVPLLFIFDNIVLILWFCGVQTLIFLSGLQKIDKNIYEAAKVDGASGWQQFWKITMPTLRSFILLNAIYAIVDISGSSLNNITGLITGGMFTATQGFGYSAALSIIYLLITTTLIGIVYLLIGRERRSEKHYYGVHKSMVAGNKMPLHYGRRKNDKNK
ncbi:MAG: carbohydrate ABC transporter permease [Saccharofermentanales bacterium]